MSALFRAIALAAAVSWASGGVALAGETGVKPGAAALNFTTIPLANGQSIDCRKAGGRDQWQVFIRNPDGKRVPAPPGSYKQKNGNIIVVGNGGLVRPGSKVMLNPQPLPP